MHTIINAYHESSRSSTRAIVAKPHQPRSRVLLSGGYPGRFLHTQQAQQSITSTAGALTSPGLSIRSLRAAGVDCVNLRSRSRRKERGQARRHERESHPTIASLVGAARTGWLDSLFYCSTQRCELLWCNPTELQTDSRGKIRWLQDSNLLLPGKPGTIQQASTNATKLQQLLTASNRQ